MSSRFFLSLKKWPLAVRQALSCLIEAPQYGEMCDVNFILGSPSDGKLPLYIDVNGHRVLACELSDSYPFLGSLRGWMERCLVQDREGTLHPEIVTLDGEDTVLSLVMVHAGWDDDNGRAEPVSLFAVIRSDSKEPVLCCFCLTVETISRLYCSLLDCIRKHGSLFDRNDTWYDVHSFDRLSPALTSERLFRQIQSPKIEKFLSKSRRKMLFDDLCQSGFLHLQHHTKGTR